MVLPLGHKRDRQELKAFEKLHPPGLSPKCEGGGEMCRTSSGVPPPTRAQDPSSLSSTTTHRDTWKMLPHTAGQGGERHFSVNHSLYLAPTPYTYILKRNCEDDKVMRIFSKNRGPWGAPMAALLCAVTSRAGTVGLKSFISLSSCSPAEAWINTLRGKSGFSCS